jgi:hypothetical protein
MDIAVIHPLSNRDVRVFVFRFPEKRLYLSYVSLTGANNFKNHEPACEWGGFLARDESGAVAAAGRMPGVACLATHCRARPRRHDPIFLPV